MTFDLATVVSLVFGLAFVGFIVGAELHSRRSRRDDVERQAPPRDATAEAGRRPSKKV